MIRKKSGRKRCRSAMNPLSLIYLLLLACSLLEKVEATIPFVQWGGRPGNDIAHDSVVDSLGNTYTCGCTSNSGLSSIPFLGGDKDAYVVKYNLFGKLIWYRSLGSSQNECAYGIDIDSTNNVYVVGYTSGVMGHNIDKNAKTITDDNDVFVAKVDDSSNVLWIKQYGTIEADYAFGIKVGVVKDGHVEGIYFVGYTLGNFSGEKEKVCAKDQKLNDIKKISSCEDILIAKLSHEGLFIWSKQISSKDNESDRAYNLDIDSHGNLFVVGQTHGQLFGEIQKDKTRLVANGKFPGDLFLMRINLLNGAIVWINQIGSEHADLCSMSNSLGRGKCGIAIAKESGSKFAFLSAMTTGYIPSSLTSQVDYDKICKSVSCVNTFIGKYSLSNGKSIWTNQFISRATNNGNSLSTLKDGGIVVVGTTDAGLVKDSNRVSFFQDAYVARITKHGEIKWIKQFGGVGNDFGTSIYAYQKAPQETVDFAFVTGYSNVADFGQVEDNQAFLRKANLTNGQISPYCLDYFDFNSQKIEIDADKTDYVKLFVRRKNSKCGSASIIYNTLDRSSSDKQAAVPNGDYIPSSGTLVFQENQIEVSILIKILNTTRHVHKRTDNIFAISRNLTLEIRQVPGAVPLSVFNIRPRRLLITIQQSNSLKLGRLMVANGIFWRKLSIYIGVITAIFFIALVVGGKYIGLGMRKGKVFQYKFTSLNDSTLESEELRHHLDMLAGIRKGGNTTKMRKSNFNLDLLTKTPVLSLRGSKTESPRKRCISPTKKLFTKILKRRNSSPKRRGKRSPRSFKRTFSFDKDSRNHEHSIDDDSSNDDQ